MSLVAVVRITHAGRFIEPGQTLPEGVDAQRLLRLGAAVEAKAQVKPAAKVRAARKRTTSQ